MISEHAFRSCCESSLLRTDEVEQLSDNVVVADCNCQIADWFTDCTDDLQAGCVVFQKVMFTNHELQLGQE